MQEQDTPNEIEQQAEDARFIDIEAVLIWIGIGLIGSYLTQILFTLAPVRLFDPAWINDVCAIIRGASSFPLEAMALILLGAYLSLPSKEPKQITWLRRWCSRVAIGFVLMIPLQFWASHKLIEQQVTIRRQQIQPADQALKNLYLASNEEMLLEAIRTIPGVSPKISGQLQEPFSEVRDRLIREVEPQVQERLRGLAKDIRAIRNNGLRQQTNDGFVAGFTALAFAAIGRSGPHRPTLLQTLLRPGRPRYRISEDIENLLGNEEINN